MYNENVLDGLDFAMAEISKRGLKAVVCFNNFWHWSGGFGQYVNWITGQEIPYPPSWSPELGDYTLSTSDENWSIFIDYASKFYKDPVVAPKAQEIYKAHISFILNRKNKYTGVYYKDDPTVFAWELCNEPQTPAASWVQETALFIKSIAPKHMVTVGLESKFDKKDFDEAHAVDAIDYACNHVWVQNRGEYDMLDGSEKNITHAIAWGTAVIDKINSWAVELGKPLVLEVLFFILHDLSDFISFSSTISLYHL